MGSVCNSRFLLLASFITSSNLFSVLERKSLYTLISFSNSDLSDGGIRFIIAHRLGSTFN
ncbi:MAG: hypothetical protein WCG25_08925 [bacterium]